MQNSSDLWLRSSRSLRVLVGVLGIALPIILYLISIIWFERNQPLESISHYYYTWASPVFTCILSLVAIFLIVYNGEEKIDFWISNVAGIAAILVILLPTSNLLMACGDEDMRYAVTYIADSGELRPTIHLISAAIFILALAYMSLFLFTKTNSKQEMTQMKIARNRIYYTCGIMILLALVFILLYIVDIVPTERYE